MGVIRSLMGAVFGGANGNVIQTTAEIFRENAENRGARDAASQAEAMRQFASEFGLERHGVFDRFMDGLNRVPRPAMALGTIGLFVAAMVAPGWFAERMAGVALVPEPLWWLLGVIVSFYFGARYQVKSQEFRREVVTTQALATSSQAPTPDNPALEAWRAGNGR
jgi:Holin of 3TMs, for gene-transfer release